ncbi:MAG: 2-hydroxyacyl-CoA dehydratase family protein, partial [Oscillospiraceae bacterium]|nr:2-hydroxyacyl-CoA dehydratase family protein [Oscillospiraceae bacterium]
MSVIIDKFGDVVSKSIAKKPKRALNLLKAGYFASGQQMKYLPGRNLLPHQKYAAVMSNSAIRAPLRRPGHSAVVSVFLPCEMLQAMDITPQFTEGLACYFTGAGCEGAFIRAAENRGVPRTYCSYHKALLGAAMAGVLPRPQMIVNTTLACDANLGTFRTLAELWQIPQFTVDVPETASGNALAYVSEQLRDLKGFLEEVTGKMLPEEELKAVIRRENRSIRLYREFFSILSEKRLRNDMTSEMYKIFFTHVLLGTKEAERYFELLLEDAKAAPSAGNEIRLLWAHSLPFWQDSVRKAVFQNGVSQLLCCDMNLDSVAELNEDRPYESMAQILLANKMGGPGGRRLDALLEAAQVLRADGVVYFCHWGCKQTLG